jgi:hypothetical protein
MGHDVIPISIIVWKQDGGGGAICLGDDPKRDITLRLVRRKQPAPIPQGVGVFLSILLAEITPIAFSMAAQCPGDVVRM